MTPMRMGVGRWPRDRAQMVSGRGAGSRPGLGLWALPATADLPRGGGDGPCEDESGQFAWFEVVLVVGRLGGAMANDAAGRAKEGSGMSSPFGVKPYGEKQTAVVRGRRMAYVEQGTGVPIVFQHGNPTSSYLWRNVMPHLEGLGRLIACDLIGMGDSDKLEESGPDRYTYEEQREYLFALWEQLGINRDVVLVIHDWGSALGFDWASQHRDWVAGIAYMEAIVTPLTWDDYTPERRQTFQALRSPAGEKMVLEDNFFVETHLPNAILRELSAEETAAYVRPFAAAGEGRRPTLTLPQQLPINGYPANVTTIVDDYSRWLARSDVPKLFINAEPGALLTGRPREICRAWPNQTEATVAGKHFVQEDSPDQIGQAVRAFVEGLHQSHSG